MRYILEAPPTPAKDSYISVQPLAHTVFTLGIEDDQQM